MKCGKDNAEMQSNGMIILHNKEVEEFECPKSTELRGWRSYDG